MLESVLDLIGKNFFEVISSLLAAVALVYAALAFRVSKQALEAGKESDLAALKLKAHEGREKLDRSFLSLQSACHEMRGRWEDHHGRHFPTLGSCDYRLDDTRHISEIENEGRKLLSPLALNLSQLREMDSVALEDYIQRTNQAAVRIEKLSFRLSPPKQRFA